MLLRESCNYECNGWVNVRRIRRRLGVDFLVQIPLKATFPETGLAKDEMQMLEDCKCNQ